MSPRLLEEECKKHLRTSNYVYGETDIFLTIDNYACIVERKNMNNVIFLSLKNEHKLSLKKAVDFFEKVFTSQYGIKIFTIDNEKWKCILARSELYTLLYSNADFCIYGLKK